MEESYRQIDPATVDFSRGYWALKTAKVRAVAAEAGQQVDTIMKNGLVETTKIAEPGDMIVTNPSGEQYLVGAKKFAASYKETDRPGTFAPIGPPKRVLEVTENVQFKAPWGEVLRIKAGGVLVDNGPGDVAGIQPDEFRETYTAVKPPYRAPLSPAQALDLKGTDHRQLHAGTVPEGTEAMRSARVQPHPVSIAHAAPGQGIRH